MISAFVLQDNRYIPVDNVFVLSLSVQHETFAKKQLKPPY